MMHNSPPILLIWGIVNPIINSSMTNIADDIGIYTPDSNNDSVTYEITNDSIRFCFIKKPDTPEKSLDDILPLQHYITKNLPKDLDVICSIKEESYCFAILLTILKWRKRQKEIYNG